MKRSKYILSLNCAKMSATLIQLLMERETAIRQTADIFINRFNIDPKEAHRLLDSLLENNWNLTYYVKDDELQTGFWRGDEWINE